MLQVLNSEENSNAKKHQSLLIKESHKASQSANEDTTKPAHKDLKKSFYGLKLHGFDVAGMNQNGNNPKQPKTEKRKMINSEGGQMKQTEKMKKIEEAEKKLTQYVYKP